MTAGAHTTRGTLLASLGRYEEARRHHERALELRRAALGADHPHQIANLVSLAHLAIAVGEPRRAGEFLDRASAIDARGENGQDPTSIESARAALLVEQGEIDSALALQVRILDAAERQFGDQSAVVANVLANLGPTLWDAGHTAEGRACTERSVALRRRHLGPGHPDVAHSLNALAVICAREGDAQGAARHYADAMEILDRHWTDPHPYRLRLRLNLAGAKVRLAAGEEAVPLLGEALAMARDLGQTVANDADCRDSHALLTRTLAELKRWPEALEAARAWADACRSDLGESDPDRAQAELFEARLLAKTGRQEEGARRLIRLYERVKRLDGEGGEGTRGFARHLAELHDGWGRADEAARWRALAKPRDSH